MSRRCARIPARARILPARDARLVQAGAEVIVARHAAPARAHEVDHREVDDLVVALEAFERAREVVQRDRTGMRDAERIESIVQAEQAHGVVGIAALDVEKGLLADLLTGLVVVEDSNRQVAADAAGRRWRNPRSGE